MNLYSTFSVGKKKFAVPGDPDKYGSHQLIDLSDWQKKARSLFSFQNDELFFLSLIIQN
jgi:hypothetical protein